MDTQKLLEYMENLRRGRKISQSDYLNDIVSQRHYYRYRRGETEVSFDILNKLADRLGIPLLKIISSYQANAQAESDFVGDLYNLVIEKRFEEVNQLLDKHKNPQFFSDENRLFYNLSMLLLKFYRNQITIVELIESLKAEIDYKNIIKKQIIHDNELFVLGVIMQHSHNDREEILNKIDQLRKDSKLLLSGKTILNFQMYFWIIKNFGRASRFDEVIEISNLAIETSKKYFSYYALEYFYYYKALAFYKTGRHDEFEKELKNTINVLFLVNKYKRDRFFKTIEKDTDIDVKEFIFDKLEKEFE